jgi:L-threonylcarbamoyladenylate synthase
MSITRIIHCSTVSSSVQAIREAVDVLHAGGLVAFPTETVYGLGADALNERAVQKVFEAKGRPSDNPLIVHVASIENIQQFAIDVPEIAIQLAKKFWPGPLTLVMHRLLNVPDNVTADLGTVALRVPNHPLTLELLKSFEGGLVGPSANISGRPSPTSAHHVYHDLNGKIDLILDSGPTSIGVESTVLDVTCIPPIILRLGGLSVEEIEKEVGKVSLTSDKNALRRSPGTRYRHYAPKARVILFPPSDRNEFERILQELKIRNMKIGAITYSKNLEEIEQTSSHIRLESSLEHVARHLFRALREFDDLDVDVILIESVPLEGLGAAIMDRLQKAALQ